MKKPPLAQSKMAARPAYEYLQSVQAPKQALFDPFSRSYRFLYRQHSRWNLDTWLQEEILQGRARLYVGNFSVFTVIDDLGREIHYTCSFGNTDLMAGAIAAGPGVPDSFGQFTHGRSPTELDREFRDRRAQNEAAPPPPPPPPEAPGGGAVAAAGAESQQRDQAAAQPPLAAVAALLAVAADGGTGAAPAEEEQGAVALLRALAGEQRPLNPWLDAMRAVEVEETWRWAARPRAQTSALTQLLAVSALLDLSGGVAAERADPWSEAISLYSLNRENEQRAPQLPKPQKYVADLVIADKIKQGACCAITMEPLSSCPAGPACVAPCYHCFDKEAIQEWLQRNETCPECRQPCGL